MVSIKSDEKWSKETHYSQEINQWLKTWLVKNNIKELSERTARSRKNTTEQSNRHLYFITFFYVVHYFFQFFFSNFMHWFINLTIGFWFRMKYFRIVFFVSFLPLLFQSKPKICRKEKHGMKEKQNIQTIFLLSE